MRLRFLLLVFLSGLGTTALFAQQKEPSVLLKSLLESYKYSEAIRLADQLLEKDSARTDILLLKARALMANCRTQDAIRVMEKAMQYDSVDIQVLGELSDYYRQAGELDKAIKICRRMIALGPDNSFFRLQLANLLMIGENYRQALVTFLPLYAADTTDFYVVKQVAACYSELGLADSAILFCLKAITLNPGDAGMVGRLSKLYIKIDEINAALILTTLYLQSDSVNRSILRQNGYCYYLLKEFPTAIGQFRKSLALGDKTKFTYKYLGLSFYKQNAYDSAAPYFREAFAIDTTDAEIAFYYGVSAYRYGLMEQGIALLERTVKILMPSDQFLYTLLTEQASAYSGYGEPDTAITILLKAHELLPGNNILNFKIAYHYDYYLRDPWTALGYYREFLKMSKGNGEESSDIPLQMSYTEYARNRIAEISRAKGAKPVQKNK